MKIKYCNFCLSINPSTRILTSVQYNNITHDIIHARVITSVPQWTVYTGLLAHWQQTGRVPVSFSCCWSSWRGKGLWQKNFCSHKANISILVLYFNLTYPIRVCRRMYLQTYSTDINRIENLALVSELVELNLSMNCIRKIEGLDSLQKLKRLNLSQNQISRIGTTPQLVLSLIFK